MTAPAKLAQADVVAALPRLRRYARVLVGDLWRADDLVQETLACAWGKPRARHQDMNLRTWLFSIMRQLHQARSMRRQRPKGSRSLISADGPGSLWEAPGPANPGQTEANDMLLRISRLAADEREVLLLVTVEELSYAEIATLLDTSVGTVLATLMRAREGVRLMTARSPSPESPR